MKSVGIIAEYNPFHTGHRRQISFLKKQGIETIVVALSGPFVQRGTPAWTDKLLRTRMALEQGVDFVFELPVLYALSSAEGFAWGGVSLLNALPLDGLCFGSECGDLRCLQDIADFLTEQDTHQESHLPAAGHLADQNAPLSSSAAAQGESTEYQRYLRDYLKSGYSYPAAREQALSHFFPKLLSESAISLSGANNILAIEYLKALKRIGGTMEPLLLVRNDAGYHSRDIDKEMASASAIRHAYAAMASLASCRHVLPEAVYTLLQNNPHRYPMQADDFSSLLYLRLRQARAPEEYTLYGHISPEFAHRIWNALPEYKEVSSFIDRLKTKNNTYSSISRAMACLMLCITTELLEQARQGVPYLRLLGMNPKKSRFLRQITDLPLITKVAGYDGVLKEFYRDAPHKYIFARGCFETDLAAADIYRQVMYQKLGYMLPDEYRSGIQMR